MELNAEDIKFLKTMIAHHYDALAMAKRVMERGENEKVKKAALAIFNAQSQEINEFTAMLAAKGISAEMDMNERIRMKM